MGKVVESLLRDAIEKVKTPEFQSAVVTPLLEYILDLLTPYLFVFAILLGFIVVGIIATLGLLVYIVT